MRHHYRNAFNRPPPNKAAAQATPGWRQLSKERSAFHMHGPDGKNNTKWVDATGHHEAVYDGYGNLVEDILNGGTYNFASPDDAIGHTLQDVIPYFIWGNGPTTVVPSQIYGASPKPTVVVGDIIHTDRPTPEPPDTDPEVEGN